MTGSPNARRRNAPTLPIYLDYQATTPADPRVVAAMLPYFTEIFGNPHSVNHAHGRVAAEAVEAGRAKVATLIGAEPREIVFTSGATESNNLALLGAARFWRGRKDHVVTCVTEHKCVLEAAAQLEREGTRVTYLPVMPNGLIDLDELAGTVTPATALVSIMAVNNEIGVIQPLAAIGALCRERGAYFHTDAAQAVGKIPIDVAAMSIDLLSISGHKLYGPKGVGALYVRRRPRIRLDPIIHGGGQERGLRSGTLATPLCVGLGEACAVAAATMDEDARRIRPLRDRFYKAVRERVPDVVLHGDAERRIAGNLNLGFPGVDAESVIAAMPDIAVSTGSACSSATLEPSYVLRALGVDDALARGSLRIGFGRSTTEAEIDFAAERMAAAVARSRPGAAAGRPASAA